MVALAQEKRLMGDDSISEQRQGGWLARLDARVTRLEERSTHMDADAKRIETAFAAMQIDVTRRVDALGGKLDRAVWVLMAALGAGIVNLLVETFKAVTK